MWRLTISQKKYHTYLKDGKEETYDTNSEVEFESSDLENLLTIISMSCRAVGVDISYKIEKVGEKNERSI